MRNLQKRRFQGKEDGGMEMQSETAIINSNNIYRLSGGKFELLVVN